MASSPLPHADKNLDVRLPLSIHPHRRRLDALPQAIRRPSPARPLLYPSYQALEADMMMTRFETNILKALAVLGVGVLGTMVYLFVSVALA